MLLSEVKKWQTLPDGMESYLNQCLPYDTANGIYGCVMRIKGGYDVRHVLEKHKTRIIKTFLEAIRDGSIHGATPLVQALLTQIDWREMHLIAKALKELDERPEG